MANHSPCFFFQSSTILAFSWAANSFANSSSSSHSSFSLLLSAAISPATTFLRSRRPSYPCLPVGSRKAGLEKPSLAQYSSWSRPGLSSAPAWLLWAPPVDSAPVPVVLESLLVEVVDEDVDVDGVDWVGLLLGQMTCLTPAPPGIGWLENHLALHGDGLLGCSAPVLCCSMMVSRASARMFLSLESDLSRPRARF